MAAEYKDLPEDLKDLEGLRLHDLIAKIARAPYAEVIRVLHAVQVVSWFVSSTVEEVLDEPYSLNKASRHNHAQCEAAFRKLEEMLVKAEGENHSLVTLRRIK